MNFAADEMPVLAWSYGMVRLAGYGGGGGPREGLRVCGRMRFARARRDIKSLLGTPLTKPQDAFAAMCVFVCVFCLGFVYVTRILPPPSWAARLCHGAADAATGLLRRVQQQHQQRRRWQWKRAKAGTTGSARRGGGAVEIVGPQLV